MAKSENVREPIPGYFATLEEAAEFWDTHDLADYWDLTEEVEFVMEVNPPSAIKGDSKNDTNSSDT